MWRADISIFKVAIMNLNMTLHFEEVTWVFQFKMSTTQVV